MRNMYRMYEQWRRPLHTHIEYDWRARLNTSNRDRLEKRTRKSKRVLVCVCVAKKRWNTKKTKSAATTFTKVHACEPFFKQVVIFSSPKHTFTSVASSISKTILVALLLVQFSFQFIQFILNTTITKNKERKIEQKILFIQHINKDSIKVAKKHTQNNCETNQTNCFIF